MKTRTEITAELCRQKVAELGSNRAAAKAIGCDEKLVARRLRQAGSPSEPRPDKIPGFSLEDFRRKHDKNTIIPDKIKTALKKLGHRWMYESDFRSLASVSQQDLSNFRDDFSDHIVLVERTKRVWAGSKTVADELREMVS